MLCINRNQFITSENVPNTTIDMSPDNDTISSHQSYASNYLLSSKCCPGLEAIGIHLPECYTKSPDITGTCEFQIVYTLWSTPINKDCKSAYRQTLIANYHISTNNILYILIMLQLVMIIVTLYQNSYYIKNSTLA